MAGNTVKGMTTKFGKLDKFEGHDFRRWQKKMHFLLTTLGHILNGMSDSLFDVYTNVESAKELWDSLESKCMAEDSSKKSLRAQDSDKGKGKEVGGPSINMTEEGKNKHNKQNKGKKRSNENNSGSSSNKKPKLECWKCVKTGHFKRDCQSGNKKNANADGRKKGLRTIPKTKVDAIAWWIDSGATTHVCKYRYWFKTYEPVEDGFVLYMGIIHETTAPYTPQRNGVAERKNRALKKMVNSMLSYSGLNEGLWGEVIAVVRLHDPKRKTLGKKGIDCIFVGYAEHSKAYRFYVIETSESVSINSIIKSRDAIFDENRLSSILRPKDIILNSVESQRDDHSDDVPSETPEPCKGKRVRKAKSYCSDFQLYLVEGSRDHVGSQYSYCYSIKEDPRTYDKAMQSRDAAFWKKAIDDEISSIIENNTWVLSDLPLAANL
nr:zinc finger, CCHC-type [Tanacetum cinerariifolium]